MFQRTMRGVALALAAILIAGCSGGPAASGSARPAAIATGGGTAAPATQRPPTTPPPAAGGGTHACDWVTDAEMTAILKGKVAAPNRAKAEPDNCDWQSSDFGVHINLHEDELGTIDALRIGDRSLEELAVGEGGVWSKAARGAYLRKGNRVLAVQVVFIPSTLVMRDVAIAVATAALARF